MEKIKDPKRFTQPVGNNKTQIFPLIDKEYREKIEEYFKKQGVKKVSWSKLINYLVGNFVEEEIEGEGEKK